MSDAISTASSSHAPDFVSVHHYLSSKMKESEDEKINSQGEFYMNEKSLFPLCSDTSEDYKDYVYQNPDWNNTISFSFYPAHTIKDSGLKVVYSPHADIQKVLYSGVPCTLTDLALHSNLREHLKNAAFQLDKKSLCKLFVKTIFYIPHVGDNDIALLSSGRAIIEYWQREGKHETNLPYLVYRKVLMPFLLGMKKNRDRVQNGQKPYDALYLDQMDLNWNEPCLQGIYFNTIRRIKTMYPHAFKKIVICNCSWDMQHYGNIYFDIKP